MAVPTSTLIGGPPIGNQPTPDAYLRLKQNLEALQANQKNMQARIDKQESRINTMASQFEQFLKLMTVKGIVP